MRFFLDTRHAMRHASANAVGPSYMPALAMSMSSIWHTAVWNSKPTCKVPCDASGWYGV